MPIRILGSSRMPFMLHNRKVSRAIEARMTVDLSVDVDVRVTDKRATTILFKSANRAGVMTVQQQCFSFRIPSETNKPRTGGMTSRKQCDPLRIQLKQANAKPEI